MPDDLDDLTRASAALRRFAAATNLLIPGRRFALHGSGPRADALAAVLGALGARRVAATEPVDYLFATGEGVAPLDHATTLQIAPGSTSTIVMDAGADGSALDLPSFGALEAARPGVYAAEAAETETPGTAAVFVVSSAIEETATAADSAGDRIRWARRFMPVSARVAEELTADGIRVGVSMVLEPKTAVLALLLRDAGAAVTVFAHPDETDDAVAAELRREGVPVFASSTASDKEHRALALDFLDTRPQLLLDDGAHLVRLAHTDRPQVLTTMIAAAEETTSGVRPLRLMAADGALAIPAVSVNDARSKTLFDNLYGTGQACVFAILDLLDTIGRADLNGRTVALAGFGHVGQGVARTVAALGGRVVVADPDPVRALQATFAGYRVAPLDDAVSDADLVISATGVADTISTRILRACAPDAVVAVAGGVPHEVALEEALRDGAALEPVERKIDRVRLDDRAGILLLDRGGCINITAGEGNPIDIMDLSFGVQLGAVRYLLSPTTRLSPGVHPLPTSADDHVAALALVERGLAGDERSAPVTPADDAGWTSRRFSAGDGSAS